MFRIKSINEIQDLSNVLAQGANAGGNNITNLADPVNNQDAATLNFGAYCWHGNDSATYENPYGKLYNWYTVAASRKINRDIYYKFNYFVSLRKSVINVFGRI